MVTGKVVVNRSMFLDGYIAGPDHAVDWIFDFASPATDIMTRSGAMLSGLEAAADLEVLGTDITIQCLEQHQNSPVRGNRPARPAST